jgi:hypothetical protein
MIIDHVCRAYLHQLDNLKIDPMQTSYKVADAMRDELSETCPEISWKDPGSRAHDFIQMLCMVTRTDLLSSPTWAYLDAMTRTRRELGL